MNHYGIPFERKVLSVFTDFDEMLHENPLGKVPTLVLDSGTHIFDSRMIIDYVERQVPEENRLIPSNTEQRINVLRAEAVALGLAEKSYERGIEFARRQPDKVDEVWAERLKKQIVSALTWLEALNPGPWLFGEKMTQADITCATAFTFLRKKQQISLSRGNFPSLDRHCDYCEALLAFKASPYSESEASKSGWKPRD